MAEKKRDYNAEYERSKGRDKLISVHLPLDTALDFDAKVSLEPLDENGKKVTKNSLLRKWIEEYTYGKSRR